MRISQVVIVVINIVLLLIGIIILVVKHSTSCFSILYGALITLAPMLIVLSILGLLGMCCNSPFLMWLYLLLKLVVIVMIAIGVFLDMLIMGRGYFQAEMTPAWNGAVDRLSDYSHWLRYQVVGISDWSHVKECLIHKDICFVTAKESYIFWETNNRLFGRHQSGCCNPPVGCDTKQNGNSTNPDCSAWSNDKAKMCYNCESCKKEFLADLTLVWGEMFPVIAALHIVLIVLFIVSCQAFRRAKTAHYEKQYSYVNDVHPPVLDNIP